MPEANATPFIDKDAIFATEQLSAESQYPKTGEIRCEILDRWQDAKGQELACITTAKPEDVETTYGKSGFVVRASQLL